ncbi:hypothetical protein [Bifidobacterium simiarum]|nr:hypothetical protein [Bifidobacterium simiarum]MBT1167303.1 hypothetical protein [Bifidobacterium simiarum]
MDCGKRDGHDQELRAGEPPEDEKTSWMDVVIEFLIWSVQELLFKILP